jgi:acyl-CoA reductase-like NAD-dependent aldehyde dehydrogenase
VALRRPDVQANDIGTVIDEAAASYFEKVVDEAVAQGARLLVGNKRERALYSPTVIDRVQPAMTVLREETFGPVSPIISFKDMFTGMYKYRFGYLDRRPRATRRSSYRDILLGDAVS